MSDAPSSSSSAGRVRDPAASGAGAIEKIALAEPGDPGRLPDRRGVQDGLALLGQGLMRSFTLLLLAKEPTLGSQLGARLELAGLETSSASLCRLLLCLEREGYVGSYSSGAGREPGRRVYALTARGVAQLEVDAKAIESVTELLGSLCSVYANVLESADGARIAASAATAGPGAGGMPPADSSWPREERAASTPIEELGLPSRATDHLRRAGVATLGEIAVLTDWELRRQGLWVGDIRKIVAALARSGLSLHGGTIGGHPRSARAQALTDPTQTPQSRPRLPNQTTLRRGERDAAIMTASAQGDTPREIAARFGLSPGRVRQILAGADPAHRATSTNAPAAAQAAAEERHEDVLAAWRAGSDLQTIATDLGLSRVSVRAVVGSRGTTADRKERRLALGAARRARQRG